jgi:hypothetical protein
MASSAGEPCHNCGGLGYRREANGEQIPCDLCQDALEPVRARIEQAIREHCEGGDLWMVSHIAAKAITAPPAASLREQEDAARDVLAERERQKTAEGWTPEHDDKHGTGELGMADGCYALFANSPASPLPRTGWPWDYGWWKPAGRRRNLVKAGALILAEIERIDRLDAQRLGRGKDGASLHRVAAPVVGGWVESALLSTTCPTRADSTQPPTTGAATR